jgi:hypothetical protein
MNDPTGETGGTVYSDEIVLTPAQSNDIIVEKLVLLGPAFENLLYEMVRLKDDLANGKIHWKKILARAKSSVGWDIRSEKVG